MARVVYIAVEDIRASIQQIENALTDKRDVHTALLSGPLQPIHRNNACFMQAWARLCRQMQTTRRNSSLAMASHDVERHLSRRPQNSCNWDPATARRSLKLVLHRFYAKTREPYEARARGKRHRAPRT
jgi:hypothetical protein